MRPCPTCRVSVIVPTLNEAKGLQRTLDHLKRLDPPAWEIIVVDGQSQDDTAAIAQGDMNAPVKLISCEIRRRSVQMNRGAALATGDVLCFVHGDTLVPDDLVQVIHQTLLDARIVAGGFIALITGKQTTRWGISLHNWLKTYYAPLLFRPHLFFRGLRLLFGDQVIFCRPQAFTACGGFDPDLPVMEDADLCRRLVQQGRIYLVNRVVQTSDRRVARWGAFQATVIYLWIGVLWGFGVSAQFLQRFYPDVR
ncbi:MAG: glycosyltransferase [Oscillatoriales cyanobacterium SM2_3_0]|nr:glycosyltransferase [Oscillatoriales cyanobacterium SM2_3_0]